MNIEKTSFPIKQWNLDDRPREKLQSNGRSTLSNSELIAILIRSGNKELSAVELAKKVLASVHHNLNPLAKLSVDELTYFKGIGEVKAISIITALELGRRRRIQEALLLPKVSDSKAAFKLLQPILSDLQHEEFWVLFLNNSNTILDKMQLSKGGITGTLVDTRLLFKKAIHSGATAIILAHNHPSGSLKPSISDRKLTQKIKSAGEILDIKVLDHLIITEKMYFSFADSNEL